MNVLQIVTRAADWATGPTIAIEGLANALNARGVRVAVHGAVPASQNTTTIGAPSDWNLHFTRSLIGSMEPFRISWSMTERLWEATAKSDLVHNNGMWAGITTLAALEAIGHKRPLIWTTRGTLSEAALLKKKALKSVQWWVLQKHLLRHVSCFHATSEKEASDIARAGISTPIAVIPHGIHIPLQWNGNKRRSGRTRRLLFLSRVVPGKGVKLLLNSWSVLEGEQADWELVIAGPDSRGYRRKMQDLVKKRNIRRVKFIGTVTGEKKTHVFQNADLFVLPTEMENFGIAIGEAMAHGVPVVITQNTPWDEVERRQCGWRIQRTSKALRIALREAMALTDAERHAMGRRGQAWISSDFTWAESARKMEITYRWILGKEPQPDWVNDHQPERSNLQAPVRIR